MRFLLATILLFSFYCINSWAQTTKINLSLEGATLANLIEELENQSEYFFIYSDDIFTNVRPITIKVENVPLEFILKELENQVAISAQIIGQQVILTKEETGNQQEFSRAKKISGKVIGVSEQPIVGVSIIVKGTLHGTVTNEQGLFELTLPEDTSTLLFAYLGMITKEVFVETQSELTVVLEEDIVKLEEVVAIGYGSIKRTENTGSITSLKSNTYEEFPVNTMEEGLKGRLTGVQITSSSGQPGAGMSVRIRGVSSIAGGNEPLYVIDGIPTFNLDVRELNGLSGFNPGDISMVEVLKDAVATSIYGSRAANGVILISTKNGMPGRMRVTYDSYIGVQKLRKKLSLMDGDEFIDYSTEYYTNSVNITDDQKQQYLNALTTYGNANTDWQDEVYRTSFQHGHNLSFSGGSNNNSYFTSLSYINQDGIIENTDFTKYSFRLNLKNKITKWLEINPRATFSRVVQNGFLAGDGTNARNNQKSGIGATLLVPPTISVYDDNGDYSSIVAYPFSYDVMDNPVAMLNALDRNTMYYFLGGIDIDTKLTSVISNTMRFGAEYTNRTHDYYLPSELLQLGAQTAEWEEVKMFGNVIEDFISMKKLLYKELSFESMLGFSAQWENYQSISLSGTGFPSDNLQNNTIQAASSVSTPETERTRTTLASFFGRLNLGYSDKYYSTFSIRYDGSSVFSANDKWATFPAIGFAWRLSEEDFFNSSRISSVKLRADWGLSGNQAIKPYQSLFVAEIVNTGQGAGNGINVGLAPMLSNSDLTWETTEQFNMGLDYGMFNERIRVILDYYVRNTKDLLANVALPESSGYSYYVDNVGAVQNKGFEFYFGADVIDNINWLLTVELNFSKNRNKVVETIENQDIIPTKTDDASRTQTIVREGEPLYSFYMPKFLGIDESGKPMYEDLNNDGQIDASDNQIAGSSFPDFIYGSDINIKYKAFSLSMNWQGVQGINLNNVTLYALTLPEPVSNKVKNIRDYYPRISDDYTVYDSDRFIEDASYLRLKNIKLSYNFPDVFDVVDDLTFYIRVRNILTFTKYSGYEPEVNSFSNDNQLQGVDYAAFPSAKTISVGISLKF